MLQRLRFQDWFFIALILIGVLVAIYYVLGGRLMNGVLLLGGVLIGGAVRFAGWHHLGADLRRVLRAAIERLGVDAGHQVLAASLDSSDLQSRLVPCQPWAISACISPMDSRWGGSMRS